MKSDLSTLFFLSVKIGFGSQKVIPFIYMMGMYVTSKDVNFCNVSIIDQ